MFDVLKAFNKRFPIDVLCPDLLKVSPVAPKTLKDTIFRKLKLYSDRMQKRVYLSTQKHFGDCDESKIFYNLFEIVTKIISDPIANIIIGEVSIDTFFFMILVNFERKKVLKENYFFL